MAELNWRETLLLAFGSWARVAEVVECSNKGTPSKWAAMPRDKIQLVMAHPDRPAWLTWEMLVHGARFERVRPRAASALVK